jgi:hypothetical protein
MLAGPSPPPDPRYAKPGDDLKDLVRQTPINAIFERRLSGPHCLQTTANPHRGPPVVAYRMNSRSHPNYLILSKIYERI